MSKSTQAVQKKWQESYLS